MKVENYTEDNTLGFGKNLDLIVDNRTFSTLVQGIYSNKLLSVVREIGTNAKDSHVLAGNTNNYDIILSADVLGLVNKITIKDYGVGLSYEEVEQFLCTLNSSSKRDDNSQTGFFGIGSKSPFAVSEAFSYRCVKNGKATSALFFQPSDQTIPQTLVEDLGDTTDANGVECEINLKPEFYCSYKDILHYVNNSLMFFGVKPKVLLNQHNTLKDVSNLLSKVIEYDKFFVVKSAPLLTTGFHFAFKELVIVDGLPLISEFAPISRYSGVAFEKLNTTLCGVDYLYMLYPKFSFGEISFGESREVADSTSANREAITQRCIDILQDISNLPLDSAENFFIKYSAVKSALYTIGIHRSFSMDTRSDTFILFNTLFKDFVSRKPWALDVVQQLGFVYLPLWVADKVTSNAFISDDTVEVIFVKGISAKRFFDLKGSLREVLKSNQVLVLIRNSQERELEDYNILGLGVIKTKYPELYEYLRAPKKESKTNSSSGVTETPKDKYDLKLWKLEKKYNFSTHTHNPVISDSIINGTVKQCVASVDKLLNKGYQRNVLLVSKDICPTMPEDVLDISFKLLTPRMGYINYLVFECESPEIYDLLKKHRNLSKYPLSYLFLDVGCRDITPVEDYDIYLGSLVESLLAIDSKWLDRIADLCNSNKYRPAIRDIACDLSNTYGYKKYFFSFYTVLELVQKLSLLLTKDQIREMLDVKSDPKYLRAYNLEPIIELLEESDE